MGSISLQPAWVVLTTAEAAEQQSSPHSFLHVRFRKQSSSAGAFSNLARRSSRVAPLKSLPGPRNSLTDSAASNSDGACPPDSSSSSSSASSSGNQSVQPYVPGRDQQTKAQDTGDPKKKSAAEIALERAAAYKKLKNLGRSSTAPQSGQKSSSDPKPTRPQGDLPQIEIVRGLEIESRLQPTNSPEDSSTSTPPVDGEIMDVPSITLGKMAAAERALDSEEPPAAPIAAVPKENKMEASLAAFERAKAYKQQQAEMVAALRGERESLDESSSSRSSREDPSAAAGDQKVVEIEIVTRDGVIKRKLMNPEEQMRAFSNIKDVKRQGVSGIDFAGLGFADKKKAGRPAGLSEGFAAPPTGTLPEVELLTRDAGSPQTEGAEQEAEQLYKPRVSTWGVFPRPADISKTYGGGRTIRPGESLETDEERKVREARTQSLLADYRRKMGLDVDPKIKLEAEKVFKQGEGLMDNGRLRDALKFYESTMNKMPAQSELHGRAALQAAVCLDSLARYDEARQVYEKLLAHPNGTVMKQARRMLFGFKAMQKLKVEGGYKWDTSVYRKYFDSFADGYNTTYKASEAGESETDQNLVPYALLLLCPILVVFALAALKS